MHVSDLHFGASSPAALEALEHAIRDLRPDVVIVSGDFTQRGRRREFRQARAFVERLPGVVIATPGNHDLPQEHVWERFTRPLQRYREAIAPATAERWADDEVAIVTLNSARPWGLHWNWAHGRVSRRDVAEAKAWLAEHGITDAAGGRFGVVVVHHPPVLFEPRRGFRALGRGRVLMEMLRGSGAGAVMSGHLHATGWLLIEGTLHMQAGTSASSRVRGEANAFLVLDVDGPELRIESRLVGEDGRFALEQEERLRLG